MARIRTVKPEFFRHEELFQAEATTGLPLRVAFAGLWCVADRDGRFRWRPNQLKLDVLPYDEIDMSRVLDALGSRGFIVRYASPDGDCGWIPSWSRHQVINNREAASQLPVPPPLGIERAALIDACRTREPRVDDANATRHELAQGEGKGKGREKEGVAPNDASTASPEQQFEEFYIAYPKKAARAQAAEAFKKALEKAPAPVIIEAAKRYAAGQSGKDQTYIKHPATWLEKECWSDGTAPLKPAAIPECWRNSPALADRIGAAEFSSYFATTEIDIGPPVTIKAPSKFLAEKISEKYKRPLAEVFGSDVRVIAA